ncbi:MAG: metallophosphoesterase [Bacteroidales bacterium]
MKVILFFIFGILFIGCDLIDYHPYDGKVTGDTDINKINIERIKAVCDKKDTVRFAMMGDSQRWYDETEDFVEHINKVADVDFVIHGGDISDFGLKKEFQWVHSIMKNLNVPYIALIGNHDVIGNGYQVYSKMYGEQNFSFTISGIKFLCMNTNAVEYDYSNPIPDFDFMTQELKSGSFNKTIAVMHAPPGSEQFNNNVKVIFHLFLKEFPHLLFCANAHGHCTEINDIFNDGILYYQCTCMKDRRYLKFTIYSNGYDYEEVSF